MTSPLIAWTEEISARPEFCLEESEALTFTSQVLGLPSLDPRSVSDLEQCALSHPNPMERERALWELCYRKAERERERALRAAFASERHTLVKANILWLAQKTCPEVSRELINKATQDADREVRDWAKLYLSEATGTAFASEYRTGTFVHGRAFDQTLPLQIAGSAILSVDGEDFRMTLSPLWFAHIQGRVMACTRAETFSNRLTIEKALFGYHPDGSDHFEIYPFFGKSWRSEDGRTQHRYMASGEHPTYLSGRVEEEPSDVVHVPVTIARAASTGARLIQYDERGEEIDPADASSQISLKPAISDVRGQYFGWAFASIKHFIREGEVLPGTVQLVNPTHPDTANLVNCYICGTFRGKLSDHNGDGLVDINDIPCHGTEDGRLDYRADGKLTPDPFE